MQTRIRTTRARCAVSKGYLVTQGFSMDWLRHERCYLSVGDAVSWDNIPSLVHITTAEGTAGIIKVGMIRTMGA